MIESSIEVGGFRTHVYGVGTGPVVVFLHGFALPDPAHYRGHIAHVYDRGGTVIFPEFNRSGPALLQDRDQNRMLARALRGTRLALERLPAPEPTGLHLFGHSLGGLLAACWTGAGGPAPSTVTLAHPSTASPGLWGRGLAWRRLVPATTATVVALSSQGDRIAPLQQSRDLLAAMTRARSRRLIRIVDPDVGHAAPMTATGRIPAHLLSAIAGEVGSDPRIAGIYERALDRQIQRDG